MTIDHTSPKAVDAHLGARLKLLRERRGLSMSAIGRGIGTSYQQVKKYEVGENRMSASTLFRLSQILDVEISDFFKGLPSNAEQPGNKPADETASARSLDRALGRVKDREVRQHLEGLLQALAARR